MEGTHRHKWIEYWNVVIQVWHVFRRKVPSAWNDIRSVCDRRHDDDNDDDDIVDDIDDDNDDYDNDDDNDNDNYNRTPTGLNNFFHNTGPNFEADPEKKKSGTSFGSDFFRSVIVGPTSAASVRRRSAPDSYFWSWRIGFHFFSQRRGRNRIFIFKWIRMIWRKWLKPDFKA